ncbi:MAG: hypothetical protein ACFFAH_15185 [Promethearchaeota archaeon]
MKKEGWEPYKFKIWYLIPLILYDLMVFGASAYQLFGTPNFFADITGILVFIITFSLYYIMAIRRMFADLTLRLKRLYFDPFLYWFVGSVIINVIRYFIVLNLTDLIYMIFFMCYGAIFYIWGLLIAYVDIRDISI